MKHFYLFALAALITLVGCKKEDEKPENPLLGSWQKVKVESKLPSATTWKTENEPCQLDDTEEYRPTGDWTLFDGANQCSAGSGITRGTWKLEANNTKIIYTYAQYSGEYESTVQELSESKLVLVQSTGQLNGEQLRFTYEKK